MKVALLDVNRPGDNKDYNGGYGTTFSVGKSLPAKVLQWARGTNEYFPLITTGYIAALLKKNGHEVSFLENRVPQGVDLVIMHPSLIRYREEIEMMDRIRKETEAKVCLVGPLVSHLSDNYLSHAHTIIKGEAEAFFQEFKEIVQLKAGLVMAGTVKDLDSLPYPDWSIYDYRRFSQRPIFKNRPSTFIQGSRSCPYLCNYCPYIVEPNEYRRRKPDEVVAELRLNKEKYGFKAVMFRDPVFSMQRKWTKELCEKIAEADLGLELGCETRTDRLDEELLDLMYKAGFRAVKIGVETPDVEMVAKYKRRAPEKEHQEMIVNHAEKLGMRIIAFYILGLPDDTIASMENTIAYSQQLNSSFANFTICTPLPGTEFFDEVKDRIHNENWNDYDNFHPVFKLDHLKPEQVNQYQEKALVSFYYRWGFFKKMIKRAFA